MYKKLLQTTLAIVTALLLFATPKTFAADTKPVLAHYMPWYVAKPYSDDWGWHWTMNHFNPDVIDASGERQITSPASPASTSCPSSSTQRTVRAPLRNLSQGLCQLFLHDHGGLVVGTR